MIKLNLGCGRRLKEGYINCDINPEYENLGVIKVNAENLEYDDNSVNEIYTSHLIEHFDYNKGISVLKEWYRVLKQNGKLVIETPDFYHSCKYFTWLYEKLTQNSYDRREVLQNEIMKLYGHFFSEPWKPFCYHLFLYTENQLMGTLYSIGFRDMKREKAENFVEHFPGNESIFLRVVCYKTGSHEFR